MDVVLYVTETSHSGLLRVRVLRFRDLKNCFYPGEGWKNIQFMSLIYYGLNMNMNMNIVISNDPSGVYHIWYSPVRVIIDWEYVNGTSKD